MNYVYIVKCSDETLYTGYTNDLEKRIKAHNSGNGAKYTRGRQPVQLVYFEEYETKGEALKREYYIKSLRKKDKLKLIELFNNQYKIEDILKYFSHLYKISHIIQ